MANAIEFVIVPPRNCPDGPAFLQDLEDALRIALPRYAFTVTTNHDLREEEDFVVAPDGTPEVQDVLKVLAVLERFDGSGPTKVQ